MKPDSYRAQRAALDDAAAAFGGAAVGLALVIAGGVIWLLVVVSA